MSCTCRRSSAAARMSASSRCRAVPRDHLSERGRSAVHRGSARSSVSTSSSPPNPYALISPTRETAAMRGIATARRVSATAAPIRARPKIRSQNHACPSYLDVHDPLDDQEPRDDQDDREHEHACPAAVSNSGLMYSGLITVMASIRHDRKRRDDPARHAPLCRERSRSAVAARPARGSSRPRGRGPRPCFRRSRAAARDQPTCSRSRLSMRRATCSSAILERHADLLVGDHPLELAAWSARARPGSDRERADEAVTGAHGRRDHLKVVARAVRANSSPLAGQLLREEGRSRRPGPRSARRVRAASCRRPLRGPMRRRWCRGREHGDLRGRSLHAGDLELLLEPGPPAHLRERVLRCEQHAVGRPRPLFSSLSRFDGAETNTAIRCLQSPALRARQHGGERRSARQHAGQHADERTAPAGDLQKSSLLGTAGRGDRSSGRRVLGGGGAGTPSMVTSTWTCACAARERAVADQVLARELVAELVVDPRQVAADWSPPSSGPPAARRAGRGRRGSNDRERSPTVNIRTPRFRARRRDLVGTARRLPVSAPSERTTSVPAAELLALRACETAASTRVVDVGAAGERRRLRERGVDRG